MAHLLVARNEVVIMDMEAGIEHLGRGTARFVDKLIVVVEPGRKSIDTAHNIQQMAGQLGMKDIVIVGNKVRNQGDKDFIISSLPEFTFLGFLPYDQAIVDADQAGAPVLESSKPVIAEARRIYQTLSPTKEPARK
jgi:CO dehydrogenase maturation factor